LPNLGNTQGGRNRRVGERQGKKEKEGGNVEKENLTVESRSGKERLQKEVQEEVGFHGRDTTEGGMKRGKSHGEEVIPVSKTEEAGDRKTAPYAWWEKRAGEGRTFRWRT